LHCHLHEQVKHLLHSAEFLFSSFPNPGGEIGGLVYV